MFKKMERKQWLNDTRALKSLTLNHI